MSLKTKALKMFLTISPRGNIVSFVFGVMFIVSDD